MRWVAGEPGQGRKAAALSRIAHAPWGHLAGATGAVTCLRLLSTGGARPFFLPRVPCAPGESRRDGELRGPGPTVSLDDLRRGRRPGAYHPHAEERHRRRPR